MSPTISGGDSIASGASGLSDAYSLDAASFNGSNKDNSVNAASLKVEYLYLGSDSCRAKFTSKGSDSVLVCGNVADCPRHGHKVLVAQPDGKDLEGFYKPKKNNRFLDGIAGTRISVEEYETRATAMREENRAAVDILTAGGGTTADYGIDEEENLKLPAFEGTPERITISSKVEKLMVEDVSDDEEEDDTLINWNTSLQGDWAKISHDGGILKKVATVPPSAKKAPPAVKASTFAKAPTATNAPPVSGTTPLSASPAPAASTSNTGGVDEVLVGVMSALLEQTNGIRKGLDMLAVGMNDIKLQGRVQQATFAEEIAKAQVNAAAAMEKAKTTEATKQKSSEPTHYYAVAKGRKPGIYTTAGESNVQTNGYSGSISQKFKTAKGAEDFMALRAGIVEADEERATMAPDTNGPFCAVAAGRIPGIYSSAAEANVQVSGFSGQVWKRFSTRHEAQTYIDLYNQVMTDKLLAEEKAAADLGTTSTAKKTLHEPDTTTDGTDFRMSGETEIPTLDKPPPVPHFLASDPSTGQKKVVFNRQVGSEQSLRETLSPSGLLPADQKDLAACMLDAVAAPGRSNILESEGTNDMEDLTEAIKELNDGRNGQRNSAVREDSQWRSISRNSLRSAKTEESLQDLFDVTQTLRRDNLGNMNTVMSTVLDKYYWSEDIKQYWSQGNLFFRIAADSLDNFLALLAELLRISRQYRWDYAQTAVAYHSKKLTEIRGTAISRLNCLADTCVYLRDARVGHFNAPGLQEKRNIHLFTEMTKVEKALGFATSPKCPKCGGGPQVRPPGKANCPFKSLKDSVARKRAAAITEAYQDDSNREE